MSVIWQTSPGYQFNRDHGTLAKCPHCTATDVPKSAANMKTCPAKECRDKQAALRARRRK